MIDLHTHSLLSDGVLLPTELIRRAYMKGYKAIAITDHIDISNMESVIPKVVKVCEKLSSAGEIEAIPGAELTHIPPRDIAELVKEARRLGAKLVLVHGETLVEPVPEGTNAAASEAGVDRLAHPGLITLEEAKKAAGRGICLELTARKGHSLTNGHVAKMAREAGAKLVLNTDSHGPEDLVTSEQAEKIARGAGLGEEEITELAKNAWELVERKKVNVQ